VRQLEEIGVTLPELDVLEGMPRFRLALPTINFSLLITKASNLVMLERKKNVELCRMAVAALNSPLTASDS
jgi:hypothetical protein